MDLQTLRSTVRYRLNNRDDLTAGDGLTALDFWINEAYREICHTTRFTELESENTSLTTSSTLRYVALPTDVYAVLNVFDVTNSTQLDPFEGGIQEYERQNAGGITGFPTKWLTHANRIYFHVPPNGAFSLRVQLWNEPATLSATTDTPVIPAVWHDAIVILATRNGWRGIGDDTRAALIEGGEWAAFMQRISTPRAIQGQLAKRRGLKLRLNIRWPHKGI